MNAAAVPKIEIGEHPRRMLMIFNGTSTEITAAEMAVLNALIKEPGEIASKADIDMALSGRVRESNSIEVLIGRLRKKLPEGVIVTERGVGYRWQAPSETPSADQA